MSRYTKPIDVNKFKHTYPCNLFLDLFPDFKDKFALTYMHNIDIILNIYKNSSYVGFKMLKMNYSEHLTNVQISKILGLQLNEVVKAEKDAKRIIVDNKDVIFNGFGHSRLRNRTITTMTNKGFNKITATGLVDSGLYCIDDIIKLKDGKELIRVLSKKLDCETVGKVLEDALITLNKMGFNTSKFGYEGKKYVKREKLSNKSVHVVDTVATCLNRITDYKYEGFSETTFKINCPVCNRFFRIHIIGKIDDEGKIRIENTSQVESGIFRCQNCNASVSVDKVDAFIRNYL